MNEERAKHEEKMDKLWPMGQKAVSEMFSGLFGAAAGGVGGAAVGGGQAQAGSAAGTAAAETPVATPAVEVDNALFSTPNFTLIQENSPRY